MKASKASLRILSLGLFVLAVLLVVLLNRPLKPQGLIESLELTDGRSIVQVKIETAEFYVHNQNLTDCDFFRTRHETCDMGLVYTKAKKIVEKGGCLRQGTVTKYIFTLDDGSYVNRTTRTINKVTLEYHQYLSGVDWNETGWLLSFKAFLITHDLKRSTMILWVEQPDYAIVMYGDTEASHFFRANRPYLQVRVWIHEQEIQGTPLAEKPYFQTWQALKKKYPATYSDVVRCILNHNYGGIWIDNDVWFLKDFYTVAAIGYQFYPLGWSFNNNHIQMLYKKSPLAKRMLAAMALFDWQNRDSWPTQPLTYIEDWVFNDGMWRLIREHQEKHFSFDKNPAEEWVFPYDLGWMDPMWLYCLGDFDSIRDASKGEDQWNQLKGCNKNPNDEDGSFWMLHIRYPKNKATTQAGSMLDRVVKHIDSHFMSNKERGNYDIASRKLIPCK